MNYIVPFSFKSFKELVIDVNVCICVCAQGGERGMVPLKLEF